MPPKKKSRAKSKPYEPLHPMQMWIVEKGPAKAPTGFVHIQARTKDQLSSFASVVPPETELKRGKTAGGDFDVFTVAYSAEYLHTTMNIVGKIEYRGF